MLKQLMLQKKIDQVREELKEFTKKESTLQTRSEELETAIGEATNADELSVVEDSVKKLEQEQEDLDGKVAELQEQLKQLESELDELNSKAPKNDAREKRGGNKMDKLQIRESINTYVRTKGQERTEGFTSTDGGALIPKEILTPQEALSDTVDLTKLVKIVPVTSGSGNYPVIKKSGKKMVSTKELAANPKLSNPVIDKVAFEIETFRGYIPVSEESIDDADYDIVSLIENEIQDQELNTKNAKIAAILKTATPKAATGLDGIKTVINKDIKKVYNVKLIISASLFNELDLLKDENGRYILSDDITVESGKSIKGKEVIVWDDDVIGNEEGDLVGFIGDPQEFCKLFDRNKRSVKWVDHNIYGQLLASFVRFDAKAVDTNAGFYVTYTADDLEV